MIQRGRDWVDGEGRRRKEVGFYYWGMFDRERQVYDEFIDRGERKRRRKRGKGEGREGERGDFCLIGKELLIYSMGDDAAILKMGCK